MRAQEIDVYRARLGMFVAAGGTRHDRGDPCPLCERPDALGRDGRTITHLAECLPRHTAPPQRLSVASLWSDPVAASQQLGLLASCVAATPIGVQRASTYARARTTTTSAAAATNTTAANNSSRGL